MYESDYIVHTHVWIQYSYECCIKTEPYRIIRHTYIIHIHGMHSCLHADKWWWRNETLSGSPGISQRGCRGDPPHVVGDPGNTSTAAGPHIHMHSEAHSSKTSHSHAQWSTQQQDLTCTVQWSTQLPLSLCCHSAFSVASASVWSCSLLLVTKYRKCVQNLKLQIQLLKWSMNNAEL